MTKTVDSRVRAVVSRWGRSLADVPRLVWVAAAAAVALIVVVVAAGGLSQDGGTAVELGAGDDAVTSAYTFTVLDAELADAVESEFLEAEPGETLLVMRARIENLADAPIGPATVADRLQANFLNSARPLLELDGISQIGSARVWRDDGSTGQVLLQPSVPSEVMIAWTIPDDAVTDGAVTLEVHEPEIRTGSVILSSGITFWRPAELVARITVPVEEKS